MRTPHPCHVASRVSMSCHRCRTLVFLTLLLGVVLLPPPADQNVVACGVWLCPVAQRPRNVTSGSAPFWGRRIHHSTSLVVVSVYPQCRRRPFAAFVLQSDSIGFATCSIASPMPAQAAHVARADTPAPSMAKSAILLVWLWPLVALSEPTCHDHPLKGMEATRSCLGVMFGNASRNTDCEYCGYTEGQCTGCVWQFCPSSCGMCAEAEASPGVCEAGVLWAVITLTGCFFVCCPLGYSIMLCLARGERKAWARPARSCACLEAAPRSVEGSMRGVHLTCAALACELCA